jgi:hypothetical protein
VETSLSYHKKNSRRRLALAAMSGASLFAAAAGAADIYYQPIVSLSTNANTNIDLVPTNRTFAEGYYADAASIVGIATPTSETTLMPRLLYNYYPTQSELNRLEGFLNLNSRVSWRRDRFTISGFFDHRDDLNAQTPGADFNPVTPGVGTTTPTTGHIQLGTTRNYLILDPTYSHFVTPLSSVGLSGEYQRMDYSPSDGSGHVDFNYYLGRAFYSWTHDLRTNVSIGAFGSKYVASNIDSHSNSAGLTGDLGYSWTQAIHSDLSLSYQQTKLDETDPRTFHITSRPWAASVTTVYTGQIDSYRLIVGRTIGPSSAGGLYSTDQIRGQYDRNLTQRLHFTGAIRYFRDRTVEGIVGNDTRNYLSSNVKLQWMLTRTIFISGAYTYVWQKYQADPSGADASIVNLTIGYRGIERQH